MSQQPAHNVLADILAGRIQLPAMPRVTRELLQALRSGSANLSDMAAQINLDPVLTSRVLQVANSAQFAPGRALASVQEALAVMGMRALEGVLLLHASVGSFQAVSAVDMPAFWRLSVMRGTSARQWAKRWAADQDLAHSAGLLQGMGHVILCHSAPELAQQAFGPLAELGHTPLNLAGLDSVQRAQREQAWFGVSHPEVSAWWATEIGLPEAAIQAIEQSLDEPTPATPRLSQCLIAACRHADALERGDPAQQAMTDIAQHMHRQCARLPDLSEIPSS